MAKKFTYRLESVLKIKKYEAKTEKENLLRILSSRIAKENEIQQTEIYLQNLSQINNGKTSIVDLQNLIFHKDSIKNKIKKLNQERIKIIELEKIQRDKFHEIQKEEKALTQLKDKKFEAYKDEINKEETKTLNEIAQNRYQKFDDLKI